MTTLGPYELNTIVPGDARELAKAIPDESVDLIFTDPIYDRIDDYRWLAETAARVLRPDGALLCWSNGKWHKQNTDWLEAGGMVYRWTFAVVTMDRSAPLNGRIIAKANRVVWMDISASSKLKDYIPDGYATYSGASHSPIPVNRHKWHKSPRWTVFAIRAFPGLVFDCFAGSGTVPAVCKMLQRDYLAFEIDPATAEMARERVANTQPPLPIVMPVQEALL